MKIKDIFKKDISRPINGVVKADQLNESVIWQELDEYVITRELNQHVRKFLSSYLSALDMPGDPAIRGRMGIWVSGFFGSGKSHFIKILSYLLENHEAHDPKNGKARKAIDFFKDKIPDPMVLADLKRAAGQDTDIILFNIDSRADASDGRASLLSVFWRVFNERLGYCGQSLHLAELERYLDKKGKYEAFKKKFKEVYGSDWESERDAYSLLQDEIIEALSSVLGKSKEAAREYFEGAEKNLIVSVENFAKRVKAYLDSQSPKHRIVFLVDEIGQFIGSDTHLMLNLQTLVEDLGRLCDGRAWVIVTSQEDIDAVLGDIKASKAQDFSKIQGRFNTRLSLSSANTDEVIQARLLEKDDAAKPQLAKIFDEKGDIVKNQLSFSSDSSTLKNYTAADDFIANYPFAPFHFQLVQKIFESIRKAGATGLHLSRGERSMLDAFQSAAKNIKSKAIGALVPLYEFYPCIESFLDTSVKRSIEQAKDNTGLESPFDIHLLQALFLIRYVDILRPNVENLVTLCIDQVDADRIALKRNIEGALQRLEKETLINRNGDLYFFLTNEEREVSREIKNVEISPSAETELLGDIIFTDVLKAKTKHRYADYNRDYPFNRLCDGRFWGKEIQDELGIEVISPLHDEYSLFVPAKCILYSANQEGNLVAKMDDVKTLTDEIRLYLKVSKYIQDKSDAAASSSLKEILRARADENRERRTRLIGMVDELLSQAEFYALGKRLDIQGQTTSRAVSDGLDYLVKNIFSRFNYLTSISSDPISEIKQILESDDVAQHQLALALKTQEPADIKEVTGFIKIKTAANHPVILNELVKHFAKRPYGWGEFQVVILIAKMFMAGAVSLVVEGSKVKPKEAFSSLSKTHQWKNVKIIETPIIDKRAMDSAKSLAKELFASIPPDGQDKLGQFISSGLSKWIRTLEKFKPLADTGNYPGKNEIDACLDIAGKVVNIHDPFEVIKAFNKNKDDLKDAADDLHTITDFYNNQRKTWEKLQAALESFMPNKTALDKDPESERALKRMLEITEAPSPYNLLKEVEGLVSKVENINTELLQKTRDAAEGEVNAMIDRLKEQLDSHKAGADFKNEILYPIQQIKKEIQDQYSIPEIRYNVAESQALFEEAVGTIEDKFLPPVKDKAKQIKSIKAASVGQKVYLESEADADEYVDKLRTQLVEAIKNNFRVRIV